MQRSRAVKRGTGLSGTLSRMFPTPQVLYPRTAGVDISDSSIKWITLTPEHEYLKVAAYGDEQLAEGMVVEGAIKDIEGLTAALKTIKKHWGGIEHVHIALPEEAGYVFSMRIPRGTSHDQALSIVEFELEDRVPIPPKDTICDFDEMGEDGKGNVEVGVSVFPKQLVENYVEAFNGAGIMVVSLEIEARSIARAVTSSEEDSVSMLVDFGRARTGLAVVKQGIPIFTTTVAVGGDTITKAVTDSLGSDAAAVQVFKNERGLLADGELKKESSELMMKTAGALADEVARHFHYWDTRRDEEGERTTPLEDVYLVGGNSNLHGLDEFIAGKVQARTAVGNTWRHVADFDDYIPPIDARTSLQFSTSVGLALRSFHI